MLASVGVRLRPLLFFAVSSSSPYFDQSAPEVPLPTPAAGRALHDELVTAVARDGGLSHEQAVQAVQAVLRFFTARLPSPLVGALRRQFDGVDASADGGTREPR
ncbi:MAG: hypothetical protein LC098_13765 [Burkholderiales bacterium]|nr:hypothetical protein [Burkholderiales bacterium]